MLGTSNESHPKTRSNLYFFTFIILGSSVLAWVSGCASTRGGDMHPPKEPIYSLHANAKETAPSERQLLTKGGVPSESKAEQVGLASWYGGEFSGRTTSSGEKFDARLFTAAHRTLPFGTWVEVRRVDTGRTVRVRINDRGPNVASGPDRIIDLSRRAAEELDLLRAGVARVELRIVSGP